MSHLSLSPLLPSPSCLQRCVTKNRSKNAAETTKQNMSAQRDSPSDVLPQSDLDDNPELEDLWLPSPSVHTLCDILNPPEFDHNPAGVVETDPHVQPAAQTRLRLGQYRIPSPARLLGVTLNPLMPLHICNSVLPTSCPTIK